MMLSSAKQGETMIDLLVKVMDTVGLAYWVEILTDSPKCTYYFGPFANKIEAEVAQMGYVEDLQHEGAQNIVVTVKRCKPDRITIIDDLDDKKRPERISSLSGQTY